LVWPFVAICGVVLVVSCVVCCVVVLAVSCVVLFVVCVCVCDLFLFSQINEMHSVTLSTRG